MNHWDGKDRICCSRFEMSDMFLIEEAVKQECIKHYDNGNQIEFKKYKMLIEKIVKSIKRCKGYETHKFPNIYC